MPNPAIVKPLLDLRQYRHITLPNKLEALLISDPQTDKSAAALDVRVGSLFDPPQWQGLAHFLEHMLFLGTTKYPSEDEYQSYLAKNGGMSNAFTADNHTCYFFNVSPDHLEGALDRFGQFFVSPLFTQSATDREVNAVHSEHSKNVQEDLWRQYQLMRTVCFDPKHPGHHFSTGNKETLATVPREVLLNFHKAWYSANVCRVAVLGRESLDELEVMTSKIFTDVTNKDVVVPIGTEFSDPTFVDAIDRVAQAAIDTRTLSFSEAATEIPHVSKECFQKQIFVVPVKEQRSIQFSWFLPEQRTLWKSKPARYLSHILGHEGPGSLTQVLKAQGVATDLMGGLFYDCAGVALFKVDVHLTKSATADLADAAKASKALAEISKTIATYIRLAEASVSESLWKEVEVVDNLGFTFKATQDPMTSVQTVANSLHYYPVEECMSGPARIYTYDESAIKAHLRELSSDKLFITCVGKEFAPMCDVSEKWYGTRYGVRPIGSEALEAFADAEKLSLHELEKQAVSLGLAMPNANPFLPTNLDVLEPTNKDAKQPTAISVKPGSTIFFKQDNKFKMPKANTSFGIYSPFVQQAIAEYTASDLLIQCLVEDFSQVAYQADIAGLKFKLKGTMEGLSLSAGGYSDKLSVLVESVIEKLASFTPSDQLFALVKDRTVRQLQSQLLQKAPYSQAMDLVHQVVLSPYYSTSEKLAKVEQSTLADLVTASGNVFNGTVVEALIEGNMTSAQATEVASVVSGGVRANKDHIPTQVGTVKVLNLESGDIFIRRRGVNPQETNGAVAVSVQAGWVAAHRDESSPDDLRTAALLSLTSQICGQKFFDDLRTKQQLGYIVHSSGSVQERRAGLLFLVQSEVKTDEVKDRIFDFINSLDSTMEAIVDEDFDRYVQAVITDLKEKPKNQAEEFQRHWSEIEKRRFDFDRRERLIPVVEQLSKPDLVDFVRNRVIASPKVISIVTGSNDADVEPVLSDLEVKELRRTAKWVQSNSKPVVAEAMSKM